MHFAANLYSYSNYKNEYIQISPDRGYTDD